MSSADHRPPPSSAEPLVAASPRPRDDVAFDDVTDNSFVYEFGGPVGAASMIVGFPLLMAYQFLCVYDNAGRFLVPDSAADIAPWAARMAARYWEIAAPSWAGARIYLGFTFFMVALAYVCPGPTMHG
ncbi:C-24(28) sterol reductase, partial [Coemansia sp. RSA 2559]